jgi:hypothetical protein
MHETRETAHSNGRQNNNDQLKTNTALQMVYPALNNL